MWNERQKRPALLDAQAFHSVPHSPKRDAEQLGGGGTVVARFFERFVDRLPFDAVEIILEGPLVAGGNVHVYLFGDRRQMEIFCTDVLRIRCKGEAALQNIFELADIAGKRITLQRN